MSLVGPRPIVDEEVIKYDVFFSDYTMVRPGMTGLWQTSGRSDTSYSRRVRLDAWYVRNWNIWLDISLLVKTVRVVLSSRSGAYSLIEPFYSAINNDENLDYRSFRHAWH